MALGDLLKLFSSKKKKQPFEEYFTQTVKKLYQISDDHKRATAVDEARAYVQEHYSGYQIDDLLLNEAKQKASIGVKQINMPKVARSIHLVSLLYEEESEHLVRSLTEVVEANLQHTKDRLDKRDYKEMLTYIQNI